MIRFELAQSMAPMLAAALFGAAPACALATEIVGPVARVPSGDTLVVTDGARDVEVRLANIGAPQGGEFYAPAARTLLASIVAGKAVRVEVTGSGGEGRVFGRVFAGELDVNLELVRRGAAWMCIEYAANLNLLPHENDAQRHKRGLWAQTSQFDARVECRRRPPAAKPAGY